MLLVNKHSCMFLIFCLEMDVFTLLPGFFVCVLSLHALSWSEAAGALGLRWVCAADL